LQKKFYSGKKKRHTQKVQLVVHRQSEQIICIHGSNGKKHDFKLFQDSNVHIKEETKAELDTGYVGIHTLHPNSQIPKKKSKKHPLTKIDKQINKTFSSTRVIVENIIGKVKIFRILSERYRNRRKRFLLRFNLIAGIYNFQLN
jgi:hypothetical protein